MKRSPRSFVHVNLWLTAFFACFIMMIPAWNTAVRAAPFHPGGPIAGPVPSLATSMGGGQMLPENAYLPSDVHFRSSGGMYPVYIDKMELNPRDKVTAAEWKSTPAVKGIQRTSTLELAGKQSLLIHTILSDERPELQIILDANRVDGDRAEPPRLRIAIAGADRLVFREGDRFGARQLPDLSGNVRLAVDRIVFQDTATQGGLVLRFDTDRGMSLERSANGAVIGVRANRLVIQAFSGDAMLAMEGDIGAGPALVRSAAIDPHSMEAPSMGTASVETTGMTEQSPVDSGVCMADTEGFWDRVEFFHDEGRVFEKLRADPREAVFRMGFMINEDGDLYEDMNFGGDAGLVYFQLSEDERLSLTVRGLITARFDVFSDSFDLQNMDFIGGLATGYQNGPHSLELFAYHQSSHLGDEILDRGDRNRIDYGREAVRLLYSHNLLNGLRLYGGPTFNIHAFPEDIQHKFTFQTGAEYDFCLLDQPMFLAADFQSREENQWYINSTLELGVELGNPEKTQSRQWLFAEFFHGYSNMGQFWNRKETYQMIGVGYQIR